MFPTLGLDQESQFPGDRCPNRQKGPSWPVEGASPRLLGNQSPLFPPPPASIPQPHEQVPGCTGGPAASCLWEQTVQRKHWQF